MSIGLANAVYVPHKAEHLVRYCTSFDRVCTATKPRICHIIACNYLLLYTIADTIVRVKYAMIMRFGIFDRFETNCLHIIKYYVLPEDFSKKNHVIIIIIIWVLI